MVTGVQTCALPIFLRAVGDTGQVISYEIRPDHLEYAEKNVDQYFGTRPPNWDPRLGDLRATSLDDLDGQPVDRVLLDMLEPWECLTVAKQLLVPGGVLMAYVATVPQLMNVMEGIREQ